MIEPIILSVLTSEGMHRCVDKNFQGSFRKPRRIVKAVLDFFWIANSLIRKSICGKLYTKIGLT